MKQNHEENHIKVVEETSPPKESVFWLPLDTQSEAPFNIDGCLCVFSSEPKALEFLTFYPDGQRYLKKCTWGSVIEIYGKTWKWVIVDFSVISDTYTILDIEA